MCSFFYLYDHIFLAGRVKNKIYLSIADVISLLTHKKLNIKTFLLEIFHLKKSENCSEKLPKYDKLVIA
jgi:hypothetical protein